MKSSNRELNMYVRDAGRSITGSVKSRGPEEHLVLLIANKEKPNGNGEFFMSFMDCIIAVLLSLSISRLGKE